MAGTELKEFIFTAGQNDSIEPAVLPMPQLQVLLNARMKRKGTIVKRAGTVALGMVAQAPFLDPGFGGPGATVNISGKMRAVLSKGIVVDEQLYLYDSVNPWKLPDAPAFGLFAGSRQPNGAASALVENMPMGQVPNFVPDGSLFMAKRDSAGSGATAASDTLFAFGYLFAAFVVSIHSVPGSPGTVSYVRVVAIDPATGVQAFAQDIQVGVENLSAPRLLLVGSTIVLTFLGDGGHLYATKLVVSSTIAAAFASGFVSAATSLATVFNVTASGYDADNLASSSTQFLVAFMDSVNNIKAANVDVATLTLVSSTRIATSGAPVKPAICGSSADVVYVAWTDTGSSNVFAQPFNGTSLWNSLHVPFTANGDTLTDQRPQLARLNSTQCLILMGGLGVVGGFPCMRVNVITSAGAIVDSGSWMQGQVRPISRITTIGSNRYVWCINDEGGSLQRFAFLLRLQIPSADASGASASTMYPISCPVEAAMVEEIVAISDTMRLEGAWPTMSSTGAGYFFPIPVSRDQPSASQQLIELRLLKLRHGSESVRQRKLQGIRRGSVDFVPCARPVEVDGRGSYESSFAFAPSLKGITQSTLAGTHLSTLTSYSWVCVMFWRDANGALCRSAPSLPISVTLTGTNNQVTFSVSRQDLSARGQIEGRIYRTTSGSGVYQYVASIDLSPSATDRSIGVSIGLKSFTDNTPDSSITANEVLYTQIGGELENRAPPACRFGALGSNRMWIGGLFASDVIQCSKPFRPSIGVEFADDDAFRLTLPAPVTGLAWLDALVAFTADAIYVVNGDGPGVDGVGSFQDPVRLPFPVGCIDWRSILVTAEGVWFQSARGLYLLPRGFGEPTFAAEIMGQFATTPICVGAQIVEHPGTSSTGEKTARWYMTDTDPNGSITLVLVYDLINKIWSVDNRSGVAAVVASGFIDGLSSLVTLLESSTFAPSLPAIGREDLTGFTGADGAGNNYSMRIATGDIRLAGLMGHSVVQRVGIIVTGNNGSAPTLSLIKQTNINAGASSVPLAVTTGYQYFWVEMSGTEQRDVTALSLILAESAAASGACLIHGLVLETGPALGTMLPAGRIA